MKAIIQRVTNAVCVINDQKKSEIKTGLLVLVAITENDNDLIMDWIVNKTINLRIFPDSDDNMNLSIKDFGGEIMLISNFTIYGDAKKGFRPSYTKAAKPEIAASIFSELTKKFKATGINIAEGEFRAQMNITLTNWGPVTIEIEKENIL